jgi:hypothetical protein
MAEKREIWSTRERINPAAVFAADSARDMDRDCLLILDQLRGRKDYTRPIMPATILAASGCDRVKLLRDHAVMLMIESLEASVSSNHDLNLFLCAWASHSRGQRWHSHRVSPVFLFSNHASQRRLQKGCICSSLSIAGEAELPRLVRLSLPA